MISDPVLKSAMGRIALLRFFPAGNDDALAALAEILQELCADDTQLARAMVAVSKEHVEWPGLGAFQETIREALRPAWKPKCAMCGDLGWKFGGSSYGPCPSCAAGAGRAAELAAEDRRREEFAEAERARREALRAQVDTEGGGGPPRGAAGVAGEELVGVKSEVMKL